MLPPLEPSEATPGSEASRAVVEAERRPALAPAARTTSASSAPLGARGSPGTFCRGPDPSQLSSDLIW